MTQKPPVPDTKVSEIITVNGRDLSVSDAIIGLSQGLFDGRRFMLNQCGSFSSRVYSPLVDKIMHVEEMFGHLNQYMMVSMVSNAKDYHRRPDNLLIKKIFSEELKAVSRNWIDKSSMAVAKLYLTAKDENHQILKEFCGSYLNNMTKFKGIISDVQDALGVDETIMDYSRL